MPIIPLKQEVTIRRHSEPDKWGKSATTEFTMKCRFVEGSKLVRKTTSSSNPAAITAEEVVGVGEFTFDTFTDIHYTDFLIYTDEGNATMTFQPLNIKRTRGLNGKAWLTKVVV